jgi:hypothetical protein
MMVDQNYCECAVPWPEVGSFCGQCKRPIAAKRLTQISEAEAEAEAKLDIGINNRSAAENRKVIETLINELSSAKKYRKAIKGGQFALFTIMGTSDWEDYASLSLQSLQLLTLANIDDNLEKIRILLEKQK